MSKNKSTSNTKQSKTCLVVFDIDETLIQFIPKRFSKIWKERSNAFDSEQYVVKGENIVIFRPYLNKLLEYLEKNKTFFKVALWTLSEREYCEDIANILTEKFNLRSDFFLSKKGAEDNDEVEYAKDLSVLWNEFPEFNTFNTVLIDDRFANINHDINRKNGIAIQPFAPFGTDKTRELLPEKYFNANLSDNVFKELINVLEHFKTDINGCTNEEIQESLKSEPLLSNERIKRMHLQSYVQPFPIKVGNIIRIGMPFVAYEYNFVKIHEDIPNSSKSSKGGKGKTTKHIFRSRHHSTKNKTKKYKKIQKK